MKSLRSTPAVLPARAGVRDYASKGQLHTHPSGPPGAAAALNIIHPAHK